MGKEVKVWYDKEGDYFEIMFEQKAGYFRETENDAVMEKVDKDGNVIGFSILNVSALKGKQPLSFTDTARNARMTISEKGRETLIKYRIEQAHEAIDEAELSINHDKTSLLQRDIRELIENTKQKLP